MADSSSSSLQRAPSTPTRVALVGAGLIARVHGQVLAALPGVQMVAVCDPILARGERLAADLGIRTVCGDLAELLAVEGLDAVHVLVPPPLHAETVRRCLGAGVHVFVEKPMAMSTDEVLALEEEAEGRGLALGVNHNMVYHPGIRRLSRDVEEARLGRLEHLSLSHNVPLRQLQTGDTAHFMFSSEAAILWEQGVHLFSVVESMLGPCTSLMAHTSPARTLAHGGRFFDSWTMALECARGTAEVRLAFGRTCPETRCHAIGSDGAVLVDLIRGTYQRTDKTRFLEVLDHGGNALRQGFGLLGQGLVQIVDYTLALVRLRPPSDPFSKSMRASIEAFHVALSAGRPPPCGARSAAAVLRMCEAAAAAAGASMTPRRVPEILDPAPPRAGEVLVLGGTGFLGRRVVGRLLDAGRMVTLLVRRPAALPRSMQDDRLRLVQGDACDPQALDRAMAGVGAVLHLATCAAETEDGHEESMAGAVAAAIEACRSQGVKRLVYVSSTAALDLSGPGPVTGDAPPDPRPAERPAYARGKIAAEQVLRRHRGTDLETVCLRPSIVVGAGGVAEHSGVGLWTRDNHCTGWGEGRTPLPLLLVDDCAAALVAALDAPAAAGRSYNLAGPVRLTAREYVAELQRATGRPYRFHSMPLWLLWSQEMVKYWIKKLAGRSAVRPNMRDFKSRAFLAPLDVQDACADLGWHPQEDRQVFVARALAVHGPEVTAVQASPAESLPS